MEGNKISCRWQKYSYKKADKRSDVVIWERSDYIKEAEKQLGDKSVYQKVNFEEKCLSQLVDKSNSSFKELKRMGCISDKTLKYFTYEFKKTTNLGKFYPVGTLLKKLQNFSIFTWKVLSKMEPHVLKILTTLKAKSKTSIFPMMLCN